MQSGKYKCNPGAVGAHSSSRGQGWEQSGLGYPWVWQEYGGVRGGVVGIWGGGRGMKPDMPTGTDNVNRLAEATVLSREVPDDDRLDHVRKNPHPRNKLRGKCI